jgi:hypothetical protein
MIWTTAAATRKVVSLGDVHSSNTSEENPFCGVAIASKSFVCNPVQQFLADVLFYRVFWGPEDIEWIVADK